MITTDWKGILFVIIIDIIIIMIVLGIQFLIFKFGKKKKQECFRGGIIWGEAIILFSIFQWYISIFLWLGSFMIDCHIFKRIYIKNEERNERIDWFFLIKVFLSSLMCVWLPQIFVEIKLPGVVLRYNDFLWMQYLNNVLCIAGILFVFYSVGFRPWRCLGDRFVFFRRKTEDKIDKFDKYTDNVICVIVFFLVQIIYAIIYFH